MHEGQDNLWDSYQTKHTGHFSGSQARLRYLANRLKPGERVLNIGVGSGVFEREALSRGLDVYCVDPSEASISRLRSQLDLGAKAKTGYAQEIPFEDGAFDAVVVSELLEHLSPEDADAALRDIRRVLRPGGRLLGTVPANEDLEASTVICLHCHREFHRWGHLQAFDEPGLLLLLGRQFRSCAIVRRPFVTWPTLNWKGRLAASVKLLLYRLGIHGSNENYVFEAQRGAS